MATTTITRATWTDGVGTGTVLNNAILQGDIYDAVDDLIANNLTFGGTISSEGFGTHALSAGGTGTNAVTVRNTSAGSTNMGQIGVQADDGAVSTTLQHLSSTFSTSGSSVAGGGRLRTSGSVGLSVDAAICRFYHSGTEAARLEGGQFRVGTTTALDTVPKVLISGASGSDPWQLTLHHTSIGSAQAGLNFRLDSTDLWQLRAATGSAFDLMYNNSLVAVRWRPTTGTMGIVDGAAAIPGLHFISDTNTGFMRTGADAVGIVVNGVPGFAFSAPAAASEGHKLNLVQGDFGASTSGSQLQIGRNSNNSPNGASGSIRFDIASGSGFYYFWSDVSGNLRVNTSAPLPGGDTGGTVVGTQTSAREAKTHIRRVRDVRRALRTVLDTPIFRWRYRKGVGIQGEEFVGIITDEAPMFGMDRDAAHPHGKSLNVANAVGLLVAAVQAQQRDIDRLKARLA